MYDEPFPAALLLLVEVAGHKLTAIAQEMLDADLGHDLKATYITVQKLQSSHKCNDFTYMLMH
jgi:hypothetical protein